VVARRHAERVQLMSTLSTNVPSQLALAEILPGKVSISSPDGGYFLWLEFDTRLDSRTLHARALTCGFSLAPGALFSSQGQYNHCLRLNSSHPWSEQLESALIKLAGLIDATLKQSSSYE
jgi:DNA-binding transcriptional MocR family regulator